MKSIIIAAFSDHIRDLEHLQTEHKSLKTRFDNLNRYKKVHFIDQKDFNILSLHIYIDVFF